MRCWPCCTSWPPRARRWHSSRTTTRSLRASRARSGCSTAKSWRTSAGERRGPQTRSRLSGTRPSGLLATRAARAVRRRRPRAAHPPAARRAVRAGDRDRHRSHGRGRRRLLVEPGQPPGHDRQARDEPAHGAARHAISRLVRGAARHRGADDRPHDVGRQRLGRLRGLGGDRAPDALRSLRADRWHRRRRHRSAAAAHPRGTVSSGQFLDAASENLPTVVLGAQAANTLQITKATGPCSCSSGGPGSP